MNTNHDNWLLNSHQNMALILESVCMFKYYVTLAAEWDFYYLHMFKDKENFSIFFSWWTAGGRTSSSQTSLNFDMNINEVHIDSCLSCCKWNGASSSGRFLNLNHTVNICFRPLSSSQPWRQLNSWCSWTAEISTTVAGLTFAPHNCCVVVTLRIIR